MSTNYYPKTEIKWPVIVDTNERSIDGVTCKINPNEVLIRCSNPPRLNEVCDIKIIVPDLDRIFEVHGEVVLSLIHISEPTRLGMLSRMPSSA